MSVCPSGGGQLAESQRELRRPGAEEAAGQSPAAAAGAVQAGGGVPDLRRRPEGALLRSLQTVRHHGKHKIIGNWTALHLGVLPAFARWLFFFTFLPQLWQGENVARELQALVKDLPAVLEEVGKDAEKLEQQIQLYTAFTHFVCDW